MLERAGVSNVSTQVQAGTDGAATEKSQGIDRIACRKKPFWSDLPGITCEEFVARIQGRSGIVIGFEVLICGGSPIGH